MEYAYFQSEFFGSGILWMLLTFPAYWLFQWCVEGEPFVVWSRKSLAEKAISGSETSG
jgi:hypothetical protein